MEYDKGVYYLYHIPHINMWNTYKIHNREYMVVHVNQKKEMEEKSMLLQFSGF